MTRSASHDTSQLIDDQLKLNVVKVENRILHLASASQLQHFKFFSRHYSPCNFLMVLDLLEAPIFGYDMMLS